MCGVSSTTVSQFLAAVRGCMAIEKRDGIFWPGSQVPHSTQRLVLRSQHYAGTRITEWVITGRTCSGVAASRPEHRYSHGTDKVRVLKASPGGRRSPSVGRSAIKRRRGPEFRQNQISNSPGVLRANSPCSSTKFPQSPTNVIARTPSRCRPL